MMPTDHYIDHRPADGKTRLFGCLDAYSSSSVRKYCSTCPKLSCSRANALPASMQRFKEPIYFEEIGRFEKTSEHLCIHTSRPPDPFARPCCCSMALFMPPRPFLELHAKGEKDGTHRLCEEKEMDQKSKAALIGGGPSRRKQKTPACAMRAASAGVLRSSCKVSMIWSTRSISTYTAQIATRLALAMARHVPPFSWFLALAPPLNPETT